MWVALCIVVSKAERTRFFLTLTSLHIKGAKAICKCIKLRHFAFKSLALVIIEFKTRKARGCHYVYFLVSHRPTPPESFVKYT
jgi:hypothetical protein